MNWVDHRFKVPYIGQLQATECGLCCAAMILRYYKSYEPLSVLRKDFEVGRDGLKLADVKSLLEEKGFDVKIYNTKLESISKIQNPTILFWDNKHYVVCEKMKSNYMIIVDPAMGRMRFTISEAKEHFSGYILLAVPNDKFNRYTQKRNLWKMYFQMIIEKRNDFIKLLLTASITYVVTLIIPALIQTVIDSVTNNNVPLGMDKLALSIVSILLVYGLSLYLTGKKQIDFSFYLDKKLNTKVFSHLLELPYKFFETRSYSDLSFRIQSLSMIRELISRKLVDFIINIGTLIVIVIYMFRQSYLLAIVALGLFVLSGCAMVITRKKILESNQCEIIENSKLQSTQLEIIYSILSIKVSATEGVIYDNWNQQYDRAMDKRKSTQRYQNIHNTVIGVIKTMTPLIILCIGLNQVRKDVISLGELIGLYSIVNILAGLSITLFQFGDAFMLASQYLERVFDILEEESEITNTELEACNINGEIELKDVSFSYTNLSPLVLKDVSLKITPGETVAIVGVSGSGKTTLSKLLLGLYEPTKGKIFFNNTELCNLNKKELRKQMGVVPQDLSLLNKTIYDNIKMNRTGVTDNNIKEAAEHAQIGREIEAMAMGYNTVISNMGTNLSGGQRQRIALARAMAACPKVMILDEATSSLDAINEEKVAQIFNKMGCTRIIIAHRLSTIIGADKILVMNEGKIVEEGSHKELLLKKGYYYQLYNNSMIENER